MAPARSPTTIRAHAWLWVRGIQWGSILDLSRTCDARRWNELRWRRRIARARQPAMALRYEEACYALEWPHEREQGRGFSPSYDGDGGEHDVGCESMASSEMMGK